MNNIEPNNANSGYSYYDTNVTNTAGKTVMAAIRSYPNNFLYSGYFYASSANNRGNNGIYWSSTSDNGSGSYILSFYSSGMYPGTNIYTKHNGFSVRCVAGS